MVTETERCNDISRELLEKAHHYLSVGDLPQASEKRWGASALKVKSVAQSRGLEHTGHRQLWNLVNGLAQDTGDDELRSLFGLAGALRTNFYEHWLDRDTVVPCPGNAETLIRKLDAVA